MELDTLIVILILTCKDKNNICSIGYKSFKKSLHLKFNYTYDSKRDYKCYPYARKYNWFAAC